VVKHGATRAAVYALAGPTGSVPPSRSVERTLALDGLAEESSIPTPGDVS